MKYINANDIVGFCNNFCVKRTFYYNQSLLTVSDCNNWRLPCYISLAIISTWIAVITLITSTPVLVERSTSDLFIDIGGTILLLVLLFIGLTYRFAFSINILLLILLRAIKSEDVSAAMVWTSLGLCVFPLLPVVEPSPRIYIV